LSSNTRVPRNRIIFQELGGNLQTGHYFFIRNVFCFQIDLQFGKKPDTCVNFFPRNPSHKYKIILYISITYNFYCA